MGDTITPNHTAAELGQDDPVEVERPADDMQKGVRVAEAVARSWAKKSLIVIYIWQLN